ncbi:MAG TPA: hypothetical protein DDZ39_05900 [Flavobacteriaceae bacterium]|jgi:polysaccharide export outer membrane protein|nr:hypothetical protein [Flavobacteriaceae bacterium]HBS11597.1 hypothetical protein [Flavobacteriaceae bacterium]
MKTKLSNLKKSLLLISTALILLSCGNKKDIIYFQDADIASISRPIKNYSPVIKPDDELTITVSSLDLEGVRPFNLVSVAFSESDGEIGRTAMQSYLVDANGNIDFPVLGTLKLVGLNRIQATNLIKDMLKEYVKDPIVNLRTINFKITVLGEVNNPGIYFIKNDRITILEALGLAGDLTIQAERTNLLLVREEGGKKTYNRINLTSEEIFNSPLYYLSQNDAIYVHPNNSRIKSSTIGPNTSVILGVVSALLTTAAIVVSITK